MVTSPSIRLASSKSVVRTFFPQSLFSITIALNVGTCPLHSYARKLYRASPSAATRCLGSAPLRLSLRDAPTFAIDREIGIEHEDGVPVTMHASARDIGLSRYF